MKATKTFKFLFGFIAILVICIAWLMIILLKNQNNLLESQDIRHNSFMLGDELRQSSDDLTNYCRLYVMTGDPVWEKMYWEVLAIRNGELPRPNGYQYALKDSMQNLGFTAREFDLLSSSEEYSNKLVWTEKIAFNAMKGNFADSLDVFSIKNIPNVKLAQKIMFDEDYIIAKESIMSPIDEFIGHIDERNKETVDGYIMKGYNLLVTIIVLIFTVILFSVISYRLTRKEQNKKYKAEQELRNAKESTEESRESYKALTENSQDYIMRYDRNHRHIYMNEAAIEVTGISKEEIIGKSHSEIGIYEVEQCKLWEEKIENVFITKEKHYEQFSWQSNGETYYLDWRLFPEYDENGNVKSVLGVSRDITYIKKAEIELKGAKEKAEESEEKLDLALEGANAGLWSWNIKTGEDLLDKRWCGILGYKKEEIKQEVSSWENLIHPDDKERIMDVVKKHFEDEKNEYNHEYRMKCKSGDWKWIHAIGRLVERDADGEPARMTGIIIDIDNHKQAEEAQRREKEFADNIIDSMNDTFYLFDPDSGKGIRWNRMLEDVSGYDYKVMSEYPPSHFYPPEELHLIEDLMKSLKEKGKATAELSYKIKDGSYIPFEYSASFIQNTDGKQLISVVGRNLTERKQSEIELLKAKEKAEESDRLKSAFLANMSHEIRTPMNGILGFTDLLKEPKLSSKKQDKYIDVIEKSGHRLLNTVNDLIDISKIESGQMQVSNSEVDIYKLNEDLFTFFNVEAKKKKLQLFLSISSQTNEIIISDKEKIYSILRNLIKNAIKYTQSGSIEFGYQKEGNEFQFFVKDTGNGISKERLKIIFDRFIRGGLKEEAYEGSGLGLSITKAYVEMLGGKIWVDSEEGVGSQFYFTIPYKTAKSKNTENKKVGLEEKSNPQSKDLKILIAEDDEAADNLLSILVKNISKEVIHTKNGAKAVELCRNNSDIDLILMDIQMPGMNGYEATKLIRMFNKDVVIIAQTAFALAGDRKKSIEAGCNDYISKPLNKKELLEKIERCLNKN